MPEPYLLDDLFAEITNRLEVLDDRVTELGLQETQDVGTDASPSFTALALTGQLTQNANFVAGFDQNLANLATINFGLFRGMFLLSNVTDDQVQLILVNSGSAAVSVANLSLGANLGSDAGTTLSIFNLAGAWFVKNRYGSTKTVRVQVFGN